VGDLGERLKSEGTFSADGAAQQTDAELLAIDEEIQALETQLQELSDTSKDSVLKPVLDEELQAAGGLLPWATLRDRLIDHLWASGADMHASNEELGYQALSCIPENYLSREDEFVRLPVKRALGSVKNTRHSRSFGNGKLARRHSADVPQKRRGTARSIIVPPPPQRNGEDDQSGPARSHY